MLWSTEVDIVQLAKEVTRIAGDKQWAPFTARGGVMDGQRLSPKEVEQVSSWPTRTEQLSLLMGQILSPGAKLAAQIGGPGGALVSQIKSKAEGEESGDEKAADAATGEATSTGEPAGEAPTA
jgi:ribosomal protein L10